MTVKLYNGRDVARILGVTGAAIANWRARDVAAKHGLPEPAYCVGRNDSPLWTREQIEAIIADRHASMLAAAGMEDGA